MKQNLSRDTISYPASQEILYLLWNLKVYYCIHKRHALVSVLSQMNSVHTFVFYFSKIYFNIILPSTFRSSI